MMPLFCARVLVGVGVGGVRWLQVNAVEAASEMQPRLILRHVIRSVDSTVQSTVLMQSLSPSPLSLLPSLSLLSSPSLPSCVHIAHI